MEEVSEDKVNKVESWLKVYGGVEELLEGLWWSWRGVVGWLLEGLWWSWRVVGGFSSREKN